MEMYIKEVGKMEKLVDMENKLGKMEIFMKDNLKTIIYKEKENLFGLMVEPTMEIFKIIKNMDLELILLVTVDNTQDNLLMENKMDKVNMY